MLGPTYLAFIRYSYCACLTQPPDFLSRFRNLAGVAQRIKIDKDESQVAPSEEAGNSVNYNFNAHFICREERFLKRFGTYVILKSHSYGFIKWCWTELDRFWTSANLKRIEFDTSQASFTCLARDLLSHL